MASSSRADTESTNEVYNMLMREDAAEASEGGGGRQVEALRRTTGNLSRLSIGGPTGQERLLMFGATALIAPILPPVAIVKVSMLCASIPEALLALLATGRLAQVRAGRKRFTSTVLNIVEEGSTKVVVPKDENTISAAAPGQYAQAWVKGRHSYMVLTARIDEETVEEIESHNARAAEEIGGLFRLQSMDLSPLVTGLMVYDHERERIYEVPIRGEWEAIGELVKYFPFLCIGYKAECMHPLGEYLNNAPLSVEEVRNKIRVHKERFEELRFVIGNVAMRNFVVVDREGAPEIRRVNIVIEPKEKELSCVWRDDVSWGQESFYPVDGPTVQQHAFNFWLIDEALKASFDEERPITEQFEEEKQRLMEGFLFFKGKHYDIFQLAQKTLSKLSISHADLAQEVERSRDSQERGEQALSIVGGGKYKIVEVVEGLPDGHCLSLINVIQRYIFFDTYFAQDEELKSSFLKKELISMYCMSQQYPELVDPLYAMIIMQTPKDSMDVPDVKRVELEAGLDIAQIVAELEDEGWLFMGMEMHKYAGDVQQLLSSPSLTKEQLEQIHQDFIRISRQLEGVSDAMLFTDLKFENICFFYDEDTDQLCCRLIDVEFYEEEGFDISKPFDPDGTTPALLLGEDEFIISLFSMLKVSLGKVLKKGEVEPAVVGELTTFLQQTLEAEEVIIEQQEEGRSVAIVRNGKREPLIEGGAFCAFILHPREYMRYALSRMEEYLTVLQKRFS